MSKYKFRCATGAEGTGTGPFGAAGGSSILVNVSLLEGTNSEIAAFSNIQQHLAAYSDMPRHHMLEFDGFESLHISPFSAWVSACSCRFMHPLKETRS